MNDKISASQGFNFRPLTAENGPLAKHEIGETVYKTVRAMGCLYQNDSGYRVYDVDCNGRRFVIVGTFPYALSLNAFYEICGEVVVDKRGARQIKVKSCESTLPSDEEGILTVLRTLHGLDSQAYKLYSIVGPNILEVLKENPQKVASMVKGVGVKRAKMWQAELLARGENDKELQKLYAFGLSPSQATKLVSAHGLAVCNIVKDNPYFLIGKVHGYTFKKCDQIALDNGLPLDHPVRVREGLVNIMRMVEQKGHCTCPFDKFLEMAFKLLDISIGLKETQALIKQSQTKSTASVKYGAKTYTVSIPHLEQELQDWRAQSHPKSEKFALVIDRINMNLIEKTLGELRQAGTLVVEDVNGQKYVSADTYRQAEHNIASTIKTFVGNEIFPFKSTEKVLGKILSDMNIILEPKQMEAVRRICRAQGGIFILNGSAGCGKTFTLNIIMRVLTELYKEEERGTWNPCILAPTGKAAKVAAKSTSLSAHTIHKALGLVSGETQGCRLINNCVVVDEFSMVDELLCSDLFLGIPKTAKVILLGDTEQLPSIRAGRVLKDLIESGVIPVVTLDVVKRQSAGSGVLINANKIIAGEPISSVITTPNQLKGNAYIQLTTDAFSAQEKVITMAKKYGLKAFQNDMVQVLSPLKAGAAGVQALNYHLQQALNPKGSQAEVVVGAMSLQTPDYRDKIVQTCFREGDCVIHTKNNYDQPWFEKNQINCFVETMKTGVVNGDTGVIDTISIYKDSNGNTHRVIYVNYDGHYIAYDNDYEELSLAYALTIHKSQGSQWPTVICPLVQQSLILNRKLLYTMYTRAQETSILIAREECIQKAIADNREDQRMTLLKARLNPSP